MQVRFAGNMPYRGSEEAAGLDLIADLPDAGVLKLVPGERVLVPTGTYMELPTGYLGFLTPRSGRAIKNGISIVNTPGTIDSDYRGEIKVALINHSRSAVTIGHGERIAQLVILQLPQIEVVKARISDFTTTHRGEGGFGSTGK